MAVIETVAHPLMKSSKEIVFNDTIASMSESETEKPGDWGKCWGYKFFVEDMLTTTRSGTVTPTEEFWNIDKRKTMLKQN